MVIRIEGMVGTGANQLLKNTCKYLLKMEK